MGNVAKRTNVLLQMAQRCNKYFALSATILSIVASVLAVSSSATAQPVGGFIYYNSSDQQELQPEILQACLDWLANPYTWLANAPWLSTSSNTLQYAYTTPNGAGGYEGMCHIRSVESNGAVVTGDGPMPYSCPAGYTAENLMCKVDPDRDIQPSKCDCAQSSNASVGNPISLGAASKVEEVTDFETSGPQPLRIRRYYSARSQPGTLTGNSRWHFDFEYELTASASRADLYTPEGEHYIFSGSNGAYTLENNEGPISLVVLNAGSDYFSYDATLPDGTVLNFPGSYQCTSNCPPDSIVRSDGLQLSIQYTAAEGGGPHIISSIQDQYARTLTFALDASGAPVADSVQYILPTGRELLRAIYVVYGSI